MTYPSGVSCRLLVLFALSGCDFVFRLSEVDTIEAPCGPYDSVTPVTLDPRITDARNFSTSPDDATLALVFGRLDGGAMRPIPLQDNAGTWEPHPQLQAGLSAIINPGGANLAPAELTPDVNGDYTGLPRQPVMMLWSSTPHQLARYYWTGAIWTQDVNMPAINDGEYDVRAGNVVLVIGGGGVDDIVRHTVQYREAIDRTVSPDQILLSANRPPAFSLTTRPDRTRPLNEAGIDLGQAVMTEDMSTLVYESGGAIYGTPRSNANDFGAGGLVDGIDSGDDEIEPWIDATCSKLYFRRRSAGQPNDPGQIFVAE